MVAEAFERAGNHGIVAVEFGNTVETTLEVIEGMAFERGYLSHHMVTDVEKMQVVLDNPYILMTDHKIQTGEQLTGVISLIEKSGRPLLIIAEEVAPPVIMQLLARREKNNFKVAAIHPPEFGHWRKAMLEDIAITTGGRVISVDLGGKLEKAELHDLGSARQVRISASKTLITAGGGDQKKIAARREQVMRQYDAAPENIERDKFQERIAKLSGGTADDPCGRRNASRAKAPHPADRGCDQCDPCGDRGRYRAGWRCRVAQSSAAARRHDQWIERRRQARSGAASTRAEPSVFLHCRQCRPER